MNMYIELKRARGRHFTVDMEKIVLVDKSKEGKAVLYVEGIDGGIEIEDEYDYFVQHYLDIAP